MSRLLAGMRPTHARRANCKRAKQKSKAKTSITDKSRLSSDAHKSKHPRQIPTQSYQAIRLPFGTYENVSACSYITENKNVTRNHQGLG